MTQFNKRLLSSSSMVVEWTYFINSVMGYAAAD